MEKNKNILKAKREKFLEHCMILVTFAVPVFLITSLYVISAAEKQTMSRLSFLEKKAELLENRESNWITENREEIQMLTEEEMKEKERIAKILHNDQEFLKKNGSRSFRNNNPGNLRYTGQDGAIGKDGNGFAIFETFEAGKLAHMRQIKLDASRGKTIGDFLHKFAPKAENDTANYTEFLLRRFPGVDPEAPLATLPLEKTQKIMQRMEGWIEPEISVINEEMNAVALYKEDIQEKLETSGCKEIEDPKERIICLRNKK